jgi:uncharacterized LabA/DUF88 family protein
MGENQQNTGADLTDNTSKNSGKSKFIKKRGNFKNDLESSLIRKIKNQKVSVYIDAANLYYAAHSTKMRIDFLQIANWFSKNTNDTAVLKFYTAYSPEDEKQIEFLSQLTTFGYEVVKKPIKNIANTIKGNMDIELAVDAVTSQDSFDILILISGDGDFTYLINALEKNYKKTIVLGVGGYTSFELHLVADSYFFLDRIGNVWKTPANLKSKSNHLDSSTLATLSTDDFEKAYINNVNRQIENDYQDDKGDKSLLSPKMPSKLEKIEKLDKPSIEAE